MAKSIQNYLGANASSNGLTICFSLNDLREIIEPGVTQFDNAVDADFVISMLIIALHKTTQPPVDSEGVPLIDNTQAIVAQNTIKPATSVDRDGSKQVEHEFKFNVYTADYKVFPIDRIV